MNLGTPACDAMARLRDNPDWKLIVGALHDCVAKLMNDALVAPPELRVDRTSFAAGARDVYVSIEAATQSMRPQQIKNPGVKTNAALG